VLIRLQIAGAVLVITAAVVQANSTVNLPMAFFIIGIGCVILIASSLGCFGTSYKDKCCCMLITVRLTTNQHIALPNTVVGLHMVAHIKIPQQ